MSGVAYRRLRDAILAGLLSPETRINEVELAQAWRVSRTPIRDALRRLAAEGLVEPAPGRGMVVMRLSLADAEELYEVREALEARAARLAAERGADDLPVALNAIIKAFGVALKDGDTERLLALDAEFHTAIAGAARNARLQRLIEQLRVQTQPARVRALRVRGRAQKTFRELARLAGAIRTRDAPRAEAAMREHLASVRADLAAAFQTPEAERPPA
ncbi:MAG: GntR family transcriptional regulator [Armatimonadota bacterium]|nr:GntR family transcriptional regulator [Armatimonadota bacterium]MDR7533391.1 GntR family transcriptional regulator [Armatimonadota bacterium]MDR7535241.1 GntR family transcriptional regulator [Armatimonadota bacterium]